jgi:uncharacterized repeat protein (TIGR01451 family)
MMVSGVGRSACRVGVCLGVLLVVVCVLGVGSVWAAVPAAPAWQVTNVAIPSVLPTEVGRKGEYSVIVENVGGANSEGVLTIKDVLPAGLSIVQAKLSPGGEGTCPPGSAGEVVCEFSGAVVPAGFVVVGIEFEVTGGVSGLTDVASVSGGGGLPASASATSRAGKLYERGPAGISLFSMEATGLAGEAVRQAGGHPHFLTTRLLLNNQWNESVAAQQIRPVEQPKDLVFYLPVGMIGDPAVTESCPESLVNIVQGEGGCPVSSRVGTILPLVLSDVTANSEDPTHEHGVFSMQPERGYPAEFAFGIENKTFFLYATVVRRDGVYMTRLATPGLPPIGSLIGSIATFYGDIHEPYTVQGEPYTDDRGAFLTDPSDCGESSSALDASVEMDTWKEPGVQFSASAPVFSALEGCEELGFSSVLGLKPQTTQADSPTGDEISMEFPQAPNGVLNLGTPPLKDASVKLPLGTTISPSSANGLLACQETGSEGINIEDSESEAVGQEGLERPVAGHCPAASSLGTVEGSSPLLREALKGHLFLAAPHCGGAGQRECTNADAEDGELFGLYLELEAPQEGVIIKLKGQASVNTQTGQITATFNENPQFPLGKLTIAMNRGSRAPLENSQACGPATTEGRITSWAEPTTPTVSPSDFYTVDWNGAGGACPAVAPFAPSMTAGTSVPLAGATSPFSLTIKREDREQDVQSLSTTLPPGLLAYVSRVARCPEPQAQAGGCPAASQIGTTTVSVGPGATPYTVTGKVYFTGPYNGAPFGLSIVVPAVAGPFNLGNVIVRVALQIDPHTAQVTAVSGPLPQILDGVPLRIRLVNVTLSNSEFTLNPTNCSRLSVTGTVYSTTGAAAGVSSPFAVQGCKNLPFKAVVSVSTEAKSTKARGTGVRVKVSYPSSGEANLAKLTLSFPQKLPVRLETLQKACRAATFEANPANCPSASDVGSAIAHTPILAAPAVGPAYLVSYGSAKFPDVVFVLQDEGVRIDVDAQSSISQKGVLTATVPAVPDVPFSTFESVFPAGRYSQFTSAKSTAQPSANQCGENLQAPSTLVAQNGASIKSKTKLQITGCHKGHKTKKTKQHKKTHKK